MGELVKDLLDAKQFAELVTRFWNWVQAADWSNPRPWLAVFALIAFIGYWVFIWGFKKVLDGISALKESWKKAGFRTLTSEQSEFIRRRSQFCRALRSDLDTLNKAESWNDQFFTDLEADIETDAPFYASLFDKLRGRKSQGLHRIPSLMSAIESSTEPWLLLVGEPGSGKSVALRHLAHQLAERGIHSSNPKTQIPLYVNLKELPPPPPDGPNANWIRAFVVDNVRRGDADTAEYIKKNWDHHMRDGIWFFLFDSFDEIPAIMHAPIGSTVIEKHADAIRQFLASMNDCRGIIASREFKGPSSIPWHKLRILSLSQERQEELIEKTFLQQPEKELVRRHLFASNSNLRHTPLFLTLLCRYVQQQKRPPSSDHDLLWQHISRLAERDPEYIQKKHGFTPTQLLDGAMELAVLFASNPTLSLAPTHDQITAALPPNRYTTEQLDHLLSALVDVKIGRSDVQEARKGDRRFTFSHRRYQETLFVRYLASHPQYLSADELLRAPRWREYTVALLQSEDANVLAPLLEEASRLLARITEAQTPVPSLPGFGEQLGYYNWNVESEIHLLSILQEGLARRIPELPSELITEIDKLLASRWSEGDFNDRAIVIRLGGLLPHERLAGYLEFAITQGTKELQDVAFQKIVFLRNPPNSLAEWVRERLSRQTLYATKKVELLRIEALCAHLPDTIGADIVLRRCMALRRPLAPLSAIARAWAKVTSSHSPIDNLLPVMSSEFFFEALLDSILLMLNMAVLALGLSAPSPAQSGWFITLSSWLPALALFPLSWAYMHKRSVGTRQKNLAVKTTTQRSILSLLWYRTITTILFSPHLCIFLGILNRSWLTMGVGLFFLVLIHIAPVLTYLVSRARAQKRYRLRLEAMCSQQQGGEPLAPQAESLVELRAWLATHKSTIIPDEHHARSLSRLIIHGLELESKIKVINPPLLAHCGAKHWSTDEAQAIFNHLQIADSFVPPVTNKQ